MVNNSVLRLFLILSIVIIVLGIVSIIYLQFDRGYVLMDTRNDFHTEQQKLINHVYETQVKVPQPADSPLVMKPNKATVVIQTELEEKKAKIELAAKAPVKTQSPSSSELIQQQNVALEQIRNNNSIWQQRQAQNNYKNDYQMMLLRNNPWSPHYQPGHSQTVTSSR